MKKKRHYIILSCVAIILFSQCMTKKEETETKNIKKTPLVIVFDVEDYISPDYVGMDDIPKWFSDIMTEEGVTGTFNIIGEKARILEKRDRDDVIKSMAAHDIGSHTNYGSIHPTVTEILEYAEWKEGIDQMIKNEGTGIDELERIFGQRPVNLARHGGSYGPQLVAALARLDVGFVFSPISLPGHNIIWFCNTLNFYGEGLLNYQEHGLGEEHGLFDDAYHCDELFNPILKALDSLITKAMQNTDMVPLFAGHPSKARSIQFWDFNYYKGANPGPNQWKTPDLRTLESMETVKKNFRRLIRYLKNRDDIELTTFRELYNRYSGQHNFITEKSLKKLANKILKEKRIIIDDHYSPAEIFSALTDALCYYKMNNNLPEKISIKRPFGPLEMPPIEQETTHMFEDEILKLATNAHEVINKTGHLPSHLLSKDIEIGTGSLLALFSDLYINITDNDVREKYDLKIFEPYPSVNEDHIIGEVAACKGWPVHRENLDMSHIIEMTKLQFWTLKPALLPEDISNNK